MNRVLCEGGVAGEHRLGILTPRWGVASQTFVHRHLTSLVPGGTVAVTRRVLDPGWCTSVPMLSLGSVRRSRFGGLARRMGLRRLDPVCRALRSFLEEHKVNAIMGEWLDFSSQWFPAISDMRVRFVAHAHGRDVTREALGRFRCRLQYRALHRMHAVVTVSRSTKQRLVDAIQLNSDRIHVIPCGVDIPREARQKEKDGVIACLSVGRMVEKKGSMITLRAFHEAHRRNPKLRLEFIGDGPLQPACEAYVKEAGLDTAVTFHGSKPHEFVRQRLGMADVFLLHSVTAPNGDEEGLPVAILEAMANGLPVISTLHAGIPEAVVEGRTGFLVAEGDESGMTRRILEVASQPGLREEMGRAGRERAQSTFSVEEELRRLRELLFGP